MRRKLCLSASFILLVLIICFHPAKNGKTHGETVFLSVLPSLFSKEEAPPSEEGDRLNVYLTDEKRIVQMDLEEYTSGVVFSEMPLSYDPEALKAQAVAARTYAVFKSHFYSGEGCSRHPEADVCTSSGCCQGYRKGAAENAQKAAKDTQGEIAVFRKRPIRAMYHASAGGHTEDAENVYTEALAYLRGVPSPGEEAYSQFSGRETLTRSEIAEALREYEDVVILDTLPLSDQLEILETSATGRVMRIRAGLACLLGNDFRRALGLRSANFEMEFSENNVVFQTTGYGHGVGMSQTGADAMAKSGADYKEIIRWYYSGAEVADMHEILSEIQNSTEN